MPLVHGPARGLPVGGRLTGRWRYNRVVGRGIALSYDRGMSVSAPAWRLDVHGGARLTGRWRYNSVAGRGIAVRYGQVVSEPPGAAPTLPEQVSPLPPPPPSPPRPRLPPPRRAPSARPSPSPPGAAHPTYSSGVRVLCSCGDVFIFDGEAADCPTCGRPAAWPTMGVVEREMRSELEELLNHKRRDNPV